MEKILEKIKSLKWSLLIFCLIIILGIFLRFYNFSRWLHFEIDQYYDILLVQRATQDGILNLPLLGPNAGGGMLRLGPAYYYLEYLSAKIFGDTPSGNATFVLLFSLASLPLFYKFCRFYFSRYLSLGLLAIFSCSLFLVLYSRFSWSPNILPFLFLAGAYSLLKSTSAKEKKRGIWFLLAVFIFSVITQIHFNVFFIAPAIFLIFLIYKRPAFKLKVWFAGLGIVSLVYSPMIANEIITRGQNSHYFIERTIGKKSNLSAQNLTKFVQNGQYFSSEFFLINSGLDFINGGRIKALGFQNNQIGYWRILAMALLAAELLILIYALRKKNKLNFKEKDFLAFLSIWFLASFVYFFFLLKSSYNIFPRFFLPLAPLAVILQGLLLSKINPEKNFKRLSFFIFIVAIFCFLNLTQIRQYFLSLSNNRNAPLNVEFGDVLPDTERLTLFQQNQATAYIESVVRQNNYPVYIETLKDIKSNLWYQLEKDGIAYEGSFSSDHPYQQGNYFLIFPTEKNKINLNGFKTLDVKIFGSLKLAYLICTSNCAVIEQNSEDKSSLETKEELSQVKTWNNLFSNSL